MLILTVHEEMLFSDADQDQNDVYLHPSLLDQNKLEVNKQFGFKIKQVKLWNFGVRGAG